MAIADCTKRLTQNFQLQAPCSVRCFSCTFSWHILLSLIRFDSSLHLALFGDNMGIIPQIDTLPHLLSSLWAAFYGDFFVWLSLINPASKTTWTYFSPSKQWTSWFEGLLLVSTVFLTWWYKHEWLCKSHHILAHLICILMSAVTHIRSHLHKTFSGQLDKSRSFSNF